MKEGKMGHKGYAQGDMSPHVEDYQLPSKDYSQEQFGSTLSYIERQDRIQSDMSKDVKKQAYKGRYSK